ncbi:MAG: cysteine desulfurase [Crocinitomicaceae bacterium]|jgi:cysteine desulfurase / selenocysteine lyase|nr:cysteine desulfurase [Crocinitomicaceae bacterium]MBT6514863.1 cysteine desulfurase [Crocinitomicaceae bacterium]
MELTKIHTDFPLLSRKVHGKPLVYLDNGATTQKPQIVIDAITDYYTEYNSNIHRGVHHLSQLATEKYEVARKTIQQFIGAQFSHEIIFSPGTTSSINLVASSWGRANVSADDEVLISAMEHHSNIVPWQMLCEEKGAKLKVIPMNDNGELIMEQFESLLSSKTKIVAINHISNTLGTINPVEKIIAMAHDKGSLVLVDGAQSVAHMPIDVVSLNADFYVFSGHKLFGPTGVGILYGKEAILNEMPPYQGGGDMIKSVSFEKTTYNELPHKFEAGTPNIVGGIGLGKAIEYINEIGFDFIIEQESQLKNAATKMLESIEDVKIIGQAKQKASVISFTINGFHPLDVGTILDQLGISIRTGHHCTQPIMDFYNIPGTIRASFAFYNTLEDIEKLRAGILTAKTMLS